MHSPAPFVLQNDDRPLLLASLNVTCHEFLGVLLEDVVDVIEQGVQHLL